MPLRKLFIEIRLQLESLMHWSFKTQWQEDKSVTFYVHMKSFFLCLAYRQMGSKYYENLVRNACVKKGK